MTLAPLTATDYYRAALGVLGEFGSEALTIAIMCERLDITKGSFYHHFGGMPDFVQGLLAFWESEHNELLIETADLQSDAGVRLVELAEMAVNLPHAPEATIRAWAHSNSVAAEAVARVDQRRDAAVADAIAGTGVPADRAAFFARLALTVLIGIQNRDHDPSLDEIRAMFDEIMDLAFLEADESKLTLARDARAARAGGSPAPT